MSTPAPKHWTETMEPAEVEWCMQQIRAAIEANGDPCIDGIRAARAWKSSQVRRFKRLRTCCGSQEWVAYRWSPEKQRHDRYILGFNYGH